MLQISYDEEAWRTDGSVGFLHRCFDFGLLIDIYLDDSQP
jgi:hypothetical protein